MKIKTGDTVKVTLGKDKGREGKVEKVVSNDGLLLVPGINMYKKHVKGGGGQKAGIYELARPIDVAKVALVCPKCKKATRVEWKVTGKTKERICKKCRKEIDDKA